MVEKKVSEVTCMARFGGVKEDIKNINVNLDKITNNHLFHVQSDIALIKAYIKHQKEDNKSKRDWTKWGVPLLISIIFTVIQILIVKGVI